MSNEGRIVDNLDSLKETIANVRKAENEFAKFSQEKVDDIFKAAAFFKLCRGWIFRFCYQYNIK